MERTRTTATENIRLRAKPPDRELIDQAAEILGTTRTQFMMASALSAAKNVLLDQTTFHVDAKAFGDILDWMDGEPSGEEKRGMKRLKATKTPWSRDDL